MCQCPFEFSGHEGADACMAGCVDEGDLSGSVTDGGDEEIDALQGVL